MQVRYVFTRVDGGVTVIHGMPKSDIEKMLGTLTDEAYENHVYERSIPKDAKNVAKITIDELPDREFRDAWVHDGKFFDHDLDKAREIQLEKIRKAREPKLVELDKEFMIALETGAPSEEIVAKKKILRDITEPLKNAVLTSIDDVRKAFPDALKESNL